MAHRHTEEFRQEAVRIALTSGFARKQVASDLGVGLPPFAVNLITSYQMAAFVNP